MGGPGSAGTAGPPSPATGSASTPTSVPGLHYGPRDIGLLAIVGFVWGIAYVFIREGIVLGASPLLFASVRYAISAAGFAAIAALRRESLPSRHAVTVSAIVGGFLVIGLYGGFLYWGEQYTSGGYASVLSTSAPILTVVVGYSALPHERLGTRALVGLAVAFVGVVLLVAPNLGGGPGYGWDGPAFVLAAFVSAAFGTVFLRKYGGGRQGLWQLATQFAVGGLLLAVAVLVLPAHEVLPLTEGVWAALAGLVALSSVIGYFAYFTLHHRVGPVRANAVAYLLPLVGIGIGTGVFRESVTFWEVAGALVVLAGVTLIVRESLRPAT